MPNALKLGAGALAMLVLLSACSVISDGGDDNSGVHVTQAVMTAAINDQGQATAPARVFFSNAPRIYAVLNLDGAKPGMEISGKWFQTGVEDVPPGGSEVHSSTITLDDNTTNAEGKSRVALFLPATTQGIPEDSWILRIYAGDTLIRTMAFVVVAAPAGSAPPAGQPNPPAATPAARPTP
jgi:hypothetical protein